MMRPTIHFPKKRGRGILLSFLFFIILVVSSFYNPKNVSAITAPTFIQAIETDDWVEGGTSKTTATFDVLAGDILVAYGSVADSSTTITSVAGGSLSWNPEQTISLGSYCFVGVWTATVDSNKTMDVTFTRSASSQSYGGGVMTFRDSDGVGASSKTNASGAPSLALTTTAANSAVVAFSCDWNADNGARTWRTINSITPTLPDSSGETTYDFNSGQSTNYAAYWSDVAAAGSKTTGLSAPTGQQYAIVAVEVKGSSAPPPGTLYEISSDSINHGGVDFSNSTNFLLSDTLGEIGTGGSNSSTYSILAGYRQMQGSYIAISSPSDLVLASIIGIDSDATEGTLSWTVITDNAAGYVLDIKTMTTPALKSTDLVPEDSFADYAPSGADPDYNFSIDPSTSAFGFSPEGSDANARYKDNGSACNTGSGETSGKCWDGLSLTPKIVAGKTTSNHPSGSTVTVRFRAETGANHIQTSGSYSASIVVTAVTL